MRASEGKAVPAPLLASVVLLSHEWRKDRTVNMTNGTCTIIAMLLQKQSRISATNRCYMSLIQTDVTSWCFCSSLRIITSLLYNLDALLLKQKKLSVWDITVSFSAFELRRRPWFSDLHVIIMHDRYSASCLNYNIITLRQ